jgi:hypothetical protein
MLPNEFGCDFDSQAIGLSEREWIYQVLSELTRLVSS